MKAFHFRIGIQFIEIGNAHGQIGISKELHRFRFRKSHEAGRNIFLDGSFLKKRSKCMSCLHQSFILQIRTHDDAAWVQVIVQCLAFAEKLRTEDDILCAHLFTDGFRIAYRNGGFYHHDGVRIILHHQLDDSFYGRGVKEILLRIIVGRRCNDDEIGIPVSGFCIQRGSQVQILLCQILFNVIILDRRLTVIDHIHLFRDNIHRRHMIML